MAVMTTVPRMSARGRVRPGSLISLAEKLRLLKPSYDQSTCSAAQVTWSARPQCARLDIDSLYRWAEQGNVFNETGSHGVRQLVTAPELLAPIE